MSKFIIVLCLMGSVCYSQVGNQIDDESEVTDDVFQPTSEWKEIKKGQSVPAGLHVRINLQTGLKEAKLLDNTEENFSDNTNIQVSETKSNDYGHSDRRGVINKATKLFTREELRKMLTKLKDDGPQTIPLLTKSSSETEEGTHEEIRSHSSSAINELKKMLTFHTDVEIMLGLLQNLADPGATDDDIVSSLEELEYYVHQFDNALDLNTLGGLSVVIKLLNHTNFKIKSAAAFVLGATIQSNPYLQKLTVSYGALPTLLSLLSHLQPEIVQRRVLYALGSLLRGQTEIIEFFLLLNGVERLSELANTTETETVMDKIVVLLTDILSVEKLEETTNITLSYILDKLLNNNWCSYTSSLLQSLKSESVEKCVLLMAKLVDVCDYNKQYTLLYKIYEEFIETEQDEEIITATRSILKKTTTSRKNEL